MVFFIIGASGVGKSTLLPLLKEQHGNINFHDFDDIGVPENADKIWRQQATNDWMVETSKATKNSCILGGAVPGEIISSPFYLDKIPDVRVCLIDCSDEVRYQRLVKRASYGPNQDIMNWGCWLRLHAKHPSWEPHVITGDSWRGMTFDKMLNLTSWHGCLDIDIIDNSNDSPEETTSKLSQWLLG